MSESNAYNNFISYVNENFTKTNDGYIPKDQSQNYLRHFGCKKDKKLFLNLIEIFYLYSLKYDDYKDIIRNNVNKNNILMYFALKQYDYNIIQIDNRLLLYNKSKDFNRNKDIPLGDYSCKKITEKVEFVQFKTKIVGLSNINTHTFVQMKGLFGLTKTIDSTLLKRKNKK